MLHSSQLVPDFKRYRKVRRLLSDNPGIFEWNIRIKTTHELHVFIPPPISFKTYGGCFFLKELPNNNPLARTFPLPRLSSSPKCDSLVFLWCKYFPGVFSRHRTENCMKINEYLNKIALHMRYGRLVVRENFIYVSERSP